MVAQFYTTGNESVAVKWQKIETKHFKVVFPDFYTQQGKRLAALLEEAYPSGGRALHHQPKKIHVIMHAQSVVANGMVAWAPKRMELYPVNGQDIYSQDWLEQLTIHEFRHVVQLDMLNRGFTKFLTFLLGQQATGGVVGLFVPPWFLEGDAVSAETALSTAGRGRMPSFEQGLKAQVLDKEVYSYEKATLGSYKNYVPNHYELGYQLVSLGREMYGDTLWINTMKKVGSHSYSFNPFLRGIRSITNYNKREFYNAMFDSLVYRWSVEQARLRLDTLSYLVNDTVSFCNYLYPQKVGDDVVALVESPDYLPKLVRIDKKGHETKLLDVASKNTEPFHVLRGKIVWSEYRSSSKFQQKSFSVLRMYDLTTGKTTYITHKSRLFAPQLHPSKPFLLAIDFDLSGRQSLVVLDEISGKEVNRYAMPLGVALIRPIWLDGGDAVAAIILKGSGKTIEQLDLNGGKWRVLFDAKGTDLSSLGGNDSTLLFTSQTSGQDNIFALKRASGEVKQLSHVRFGATYGELSSADTLLFSNYTANGYRIAMKKNGEECRPVENIGFTNCKEAVLSARELIKPSFDNVDTTSLVVKNYSRLNLFNFHSWGPYLYEGEAIYSGLSVMSQNLLGNTILSAGINSLEEYSYEKYYFGIRYTGFFADISLEAKYGERQMNYSIVESLDANNNQVVLHQSNDYQSQLSLNPEISVPINFSKGNYSGFVVPLVGVLYQQFGEVDEAQTRYVLSGGNYYPVETRSAVTSSYDYLSLRYGLNFQWIRYASPRDVWSKFGTKLEGYYQYSPWSDLSKGSLFSVRNDWYFGGFMRHDGFHAAFIYENKKPFEKSGIIYSYPAVFPVARGYTNLAFEDILTFKADYQLPVLCPDAVLSGAVYLKRIRFNLFGDYSCYARRNATNGRDCYGVSSFGNDVWADVHLFQWSVPFSFGYRFGYKPTEDQKFYEFLWSVSF